jgi:glucosamine kinase
VAYYLGIDGGGSKTTCAVGDERSVRATVTGGASNITRVGESGAREALHRVMLEACSAAGITLPQVRRACIGVAGAGREEVAGIVRKIVAEIVSAEIEIVGDMEIAMAAAFETGPGVIVIAGTGSIAYGRDAQGRSTRAGGWGFAVSDEGSAHWIGRTAVSAVLRAADEAGVEHSALEHAALEHSVLEHAGLEHEDRDQAWPAVRLFHELKIAWRMNSMPELARAANAKPDFAALFPAVLAAAEAGDAVARGVITQAAGELAQLAGIVLRRLFPGQDSASSVAVPMAMAGGVFRHAPMIRELFYNEVLAAHPRVLLKPEVVDPVHGALQMARRAAS